MKGETLSVEFINLTPHELNVRKEDGSFLTVPPSGTVARVSVQAMTMGRIDGVVITGQAFESDISGVPPRKDGTYYVVSRLAADALKEEGRVEDILIPGPAIRDEDGKIVGCDGFSVL